MEQTYLVVRKPDGALVVVGYGCYCPGVVVAEFDDLEAAHAFAG